MYIAVLIDAENVEPAYADQIFTYAESMGTITVKEIYGAGIALNEWAGPILQYAIHMNMTLRPNRYKNSSDIALVIGAMDLLAKRELYRFQAASGPEGTERPGHRRGEEAKEAVDAMVIASSDSDFSALAIRLRTAGVEVIGMGNPEKTNHTWPVACSGYVALTPVEPAKQQAQPAQKAKQTPPKTEQPQKKAEPAQKKTEQPQKKTEPQPPKQKKPEPKQSQSAKEEETKVAPTHSARTEIIRSAITAQIAANGGRVHITKLLSQLYEVPDYRFDQQGSKRRPLDYILRQYGENFHFEKDAEGHYWVSMNPAAPEPETPDMEAAETPAAEAPEAEAAPSVPEAAVEPAREEFTVPEETANTEAETESAGEQEEPRPGTAAQLSPAPFVAAGVPEDTARQIVAVWTESPNLRAVYNALRKQFGSADGRKFHQLLKEQLAQPAEAAAAQE